MNLPTGVCATASLDGTVLLEWDDAEADRYRVLVETRGSGEWRMIDETPLCWARVSGLKPELTYWFRVEAVFRSLATLIAVPESVTPTR